MKLKLNITRSAGENADELFTRAKKLESKAEAAVGAVTDLEGKIALLEKADAERAEPERTVLKKRRWFEKFRWFESAEGNLIFGGRDATTNEIAIKKHTTPESIVFHADVSGSPFFVAPADATPRELSETAIATASYSRAWKKGVGELEVYWVRGSQVSKTTKSGEYMGKGSFMIYGSREFMKAKLEVAVGFSDQLIAGPVASVSAHTKNFVTIVPGSTKSSDIAKQIRTRLGIKAKLDDLIRLLPPGDCDLKKNLR